MMHHDGALSGQSHQGQSGACLPRRRCEWAILSMSSDLPYRSRAVRAMVLLHEEHLRRFVQTWRLAIAGPASLPPTADPNYASLGALGRHVLSAAGGYLVWICEVLRLPDPEVRPAPDAVALVRDADDYLEHILERWRAEALREISDENWRLPSIHRVG